MASECLLSFAVICKGCGAEIGPSMDADKLQSIAEERGWRVVRGSVYCKDCADALLGGETGAVEVSPSVEKLLAALALELSDHGDCPMDYSDWQCPATPETHDCEMGPAALCWLIYYGLVDTYTEAQTLWARMEDAAHAD